MKDDPYWITTQHAGHCSGSRNAKHAAVLGIPAGSRAFYYPRGKYLLCQQCGEAASREFEAARDDEQAYSS